LQGIISCVSRGLHGFRFLFMRTTQFNSEFVREHTMDLLEANSVATSDRTQNQALNHSSRLGLPSILQLMILYLSPLRVQSKFDERTALSGRFSVRSDSFHRVMFKRLVGLACDRVATNYPLPLIEFRLYSLCSTSRIWVPVTFQCTMTVILFV
jgi:hypothetical protein